MRILGVDSSGMVASVALVEDDLLVAEYSVNYKKTHSQTLLPMLDEIVKMTELDLNTIDAIAVAAGPGSFTGLRIGAGSMSGILGLVLSFGAIVMLVIGWNTTSCRSQDHHTDNTPRPALPVPQALCRLQRFLLR